MQKDDLVYVGHMFDNATSAVRKLEGSERSHYDADENLRLALTHLVQTIGEAAKRVSPVFRDTHPEIPWRQITGMRDKLVHDYLEVDYDLVWEVVTADLPILLPRLEALLAGASS